MGGAVGVLAAAKDERIELLVSAGMVHTKFCETEFGEVTPGKGNMWDRGCPLSKAYVDDMNKINTVLNKTEKIEVPGCSFTATKTTSFLWRRTGNVWGCHEPKELVILEAWIMSSVVTARAR